MRASIIIPTFNRLWSLPETLASCPRSPDIEIIVVDDGSTDRTWEWLSEQPGIISLRQTNWGKPAAVNLGLSRATGLYVKFLDSDDLLVPEAVIAQLDQAMAENADICVAGYRAWYERDGQEAEHFWNDCGDFIAQQLGECDSSHYSAFFFRRLFIDGIRHRPEYAFRDDRMFILECALKEPSVSIFPHPTFVHRHHSRARIQFRPGLVAKVTDWQELHMFRKIAALLRADNRLTARRRAAMSGNLWALAQRVSAYDRKEGREILAWLHELDPDFRVPPGGRNRLYRWLGFPMAQTIVNTGRALRDATRDRTANAGPHE